MLKKVLTVILLCVVVISFASYLCFASVESLDIQDMVASIASICLASRGLQSFGLTHGYNGTNYYDEGWAKFYADDNDYNVKVGVVKSSGTYGKKTTRVNVGATKKCYSYQVTGNDGLSAWVQYYVA